MGENSLMIKRSPSEKAESVPNDPRTTIEPLECSPGRCPKPATKRPGRKNAADPLNRTLAINTAPPGTHSLCASNPAHSTQKVRHFTHPVHNPSKVLIYKTANPAKIFMSLFYMIFLILTRI
jgi:hypothetical protein